MNLGWVNDLIDAHILGYKNQEYLGYMDPMQYEVAVTTLERFRESVKQFIKDSNELNKKGQV